MKRTVRTGPRRWVIPPAITRGPGEKIDQVGVLAEHDDATSVLLWRLVRDVELWATTPVHKRTELFAAGAPDGRRSRLRESTIPTDVRLFVRTVNRILAGAPDAPGAHEEAATACAGIAQWAREIEARETAVAFGQAAALVSDDARYALLTGTCAKELGQTARAASWYARVIGLARRGQDWRSYAAAHLALGELPEAAGEPALARKRYLRALRTARRNRAFALERARAAYGLFRLARDAGEQEAAGAYARLATVALLKADPSAVHLTFALADHWITSGTPKNALRLLRHLAKLDAIPPAQQLPATILRIRAATAAGDGFSAKLTWADAWALATSGHRPEPFADTLLQLAACAAELGEVGGIEEAGRAALVHAPAEDYPRIHAELRRIAGGRVDFGPPLKGAA